MDESGIHEGAHVCVVGGYYGAEHRWRRFEQEWAQIIGGANIEEFHAHKFWARERDGSRKGEYKGWTDEKANAFLQALVECVSSNKIYPMSAVLKIDAWKKLTKTERMFLTGGRQDPQTKKWLTTSAPNRTYFMPFQFCVGFPAQHCKYGFTIHYTFALNKQFKTHAASLYELIEADETLSFSRPSVTPLSQPLVGLFRMCRHTSRATLRPGCAGSYFGFGSFCLGGDCASALVED